jgi:diguanylate cyclase (GGDEF)-like protein
MSGQQVPVTVRSACDDQVVLAVWRSALLGIPASLVLALILGRSVPFAARVEFVTLVSVADVTCFVVLTSYRRRRRRSEDLGRYWPGPVCAALIGLAWGSLALIGLPDGRHSEQRIVYLLFLAGVSATYVVGAAARRLYFWASQISMIALPAIVFLRSGDHLTELLGVAILIYFAVMTALHRDVHNLVLSEITLRQKNEEATRELAYQATHDSLTGLASRAKFIDQLNEAFTFSDQASIGLVYIDLDRFKVVNDSLGHAAGDDLLKQVASRIREVLDEQALLARVGGDEFTVLVRGVNPQAIRTADRIAGALEAPFQVSGRRLNISASMGVATALSGDSDAATLLGEADAAQYRAKQTGGNRIEIFNVRLRQALAQRLDEEQGVRRAINEGEIVACYQPIVELHSGQIVAVEALARWMHPTRGTLDAGKFVPIIEEAGLITALDERIIGQAVHDAREIVASSHRHGFRIWCNASAAHFSRMHPSERLEHLLEAAGCDGSAIGFEITETALVEDLDAAARELNAARDLGVKIALDDFGIGHSSLLLLRTLPIDAVKVDRSFVRDITRDTTAAALVASVISLATRLGIDVVAEGVETPQQAQLLAEFGCRYAQGHIWAKALPVDRLAQALGANHNTPTVITGHLRPSDNATPHAYNG